MNHDVYVIAAIRTAVSPVNGELKRAEVHELAAPVLARCLQEASLTGGDVDEVIMSNALYGGGNPARLASLAAGLPERIGGLSIDRQCCGGLDAIVLGLQMIQAGAGEIVLAGGAESFSRRPLRHRTDPDAAQTTPYERPPFTPWPDRDPDLNQAAAQLALERSISRQTQDQWAIASHRRAQDSQNRLREEIVTVPGTILNDDAFTRTLSNRLCQRAPILAGSVTVANTAVAADGAAFVLLVSAQKWREMNRPYALKLRTGISLGGDPQSPATAPVEAIRLSLAKARQTPTDLSMAEIMEAYAVQCMVCVDDSGLGDIPVNVGGGALARGHPIGASGAILVVRLFHELRRKGVGLGLAAIAAAGGLGTAALFESS